MTQQFVRFFFFFFFSCLPVRSERTRSALVIGLMGNFRRDLLVRGISEAASRPRLALSWINASGDRYDVRNSTREHVLISLFNTSRR